MNNLHLFYEFFTAGFFSEVLDIISLIAVSSGILVIINKNPIVSLLFLIILFASISVYLIIIGLTFIGLTYLVVYIGAVSILFLFILMLINIRVSEFQSNTSNNIILSIIITVIFNNIFFQVLSNNIIMLDNFKYFIDKIYENISYKFSSMYLYKTNKTLYYTASKSWDGYLEEDNHIISIGNIMYTNYNMWLILASLILLLAMVGAIIITIKQKK